MSDKTEITLSIFTPLEKYFELVCIKCPTFKNCDDEYLRMLASKNCDVTKGISEEFKECLKQFALNIKTADRVMSNKTIKGELKNIFKTEFEKLGKLEDDVEDFDSKKEKLLNDIIKRINSNDKIKSTGFKMSNKVEEGEAKTYEQVLKEIEIDGANLKEKMVKLLNKWLSESFINIYSESMEYFKNIFLPDLSDKESIPVNRCQKKLMETFFELRDASSNTTITWESFWGNAEPGSWGKGSSARDLRLNVKVDEHRGMASIAMLFPRELRNKFNEYLIAPKFKGEDELTYSFNGTKCPKYAVPNAEPILKFFKNEIIGLKTNKFKGEEYTPDGPDEASYTDSDADKTEYKFKETFEDEIKNYTDLWRADLKGNLYKKVGDKYELYTDDDLLRDAELFKNKEGECGNLCIFDDSKKCVEFFQDMMKKDSSSYPAEKLSELINSASFVTSYKSLKENLVNVNPLFIIGTLRMFGFEKYSELNTDGTKVVKIEPFSRWWGRNKNVIGNESRERPFPGSHPTGDLENPPANLELFFKLLIEFINNNQFVLNPQTKEVVAKNGRINKDSIITEPKEYIWIKGERVKNPYYEKELAYWEGRKYSGKKSTMGFTDLLETIKKNSSSYGGVDMRTSENILNLRTLLGLMVGVTTGGKIRLSKSPQFMTGIGYGLYGGSDEVKGMEKFLPCSTQANEIYAIGKKALKNRNKELKPSDEIELKNILKELSQAESKVYEKLHLLSKYIEVLKTLNDNVENDSLTWSMMEDEFKKYENSSSKLSEKADYTIITLLKKLYDDIPSGPRSYYSPL